MCDVVRGTGRSLVHTITCASGGSEQAGDNGAYCEAEHHEHDCARDHGDSYEEDVREDAGA